MCGDDDDLNQVDEELFNRFLEFAESFGIRPDSKAANSSFGLTNEEDRKRYMDGLFKAGLSRAVNDAQSLQNGEKMDLLAGQAIVFARLSGYLAGQFPPDSDLFHTVISALMQGHQQAAGAKAAS